MSSRRLVPSPERLVGSVLAAVVLTAVVVAAVGTATAEEPPAEPAPDVGYTMLGRGYAAILGYPADEVPGGDDGGEAEEPPPPPPAQTCPEHQQGVDEALQARLDRLTDVEDAEPVEATENEVPTPRGQPIKFDFGLADTSLRSDPGSHAIASFFYVDLGGGQDPWTTTEADGYASGHAREEERCGQPYFGRPGTAEEVHVISRAIEGPYAYAFHQAQRQVLPGGLTIQESVTVAEMEGRSGPIRSEVVTIVSGVAVGELRADEVVTVLTYETDGTEAGTHRTASTHVAGLEVAGTPLELTPGAPPVTAGSLLVGIAAPEVRQLTNGGTEVTAGGLYIAGELPNPVGLQAKQALFVGGAWLDTSLSSFPSFDDDFGEEFAGGTAAPAAPPLDDLAAGTDATFDAVGPSVPAGGFEVATDTIASEGAGDRPALVAEEAPSIAQPVSQVASARLGVYRAPTQAAGPLLILLAFAGASWCTGFVWMRHRYPEIRAALTTPPLRWLDTAYRSFLRG